jgi:hypothetical protein
MFLPEFEPTIPGSERPQTHVLDRAATRIGCNIPSDTNSGTHNTNIFAKEKADNEVDPSQMCTFFPFLFSREKYSICGYLLHLSSLLRLDNFM